MARPPSSPEHGDSPARPYRATKGCWDSTHREGAWGAPLAHRNRPVVILRLLAGPVPGDRLSEPAPGLAHPSLGPRAHRHHMPLGQKPLSARPRQALRAVQTVGNST